MAKERKKPSRSCGVKKKVVEKTGSLNEGLSVMKRSDSKVNCSDFASKALKRSRSARDFCTVSIPGLSSLSNILINETEHRYYLVTKDDSAPFCEVANETTYSRCGIPSHTHRVVTYPFVTLSPTDRAFDLLLADDLLTVTGFEGYRVARATHSVSHGTWYYEVNFLSQPGGSHIRIGWSQIDSPVQACVGYTPFSYSWRSLHGTKFHDGKGKHYADGGYKQGDVLGCLISFASCPADDNFTYASAVELPSSSSYLPSTYKDMPLVKSRGGFYFEEAVSCRKVAARHLRPSPDSYIEFFKNGVSCGVAFQNIFAGFYFPAISVYGSGTIKCNFGPNLKYPVPGAKAMSGRPDEQEVEQALADLLYHVENEEAIVEEVKKYRA